MTPGSDFPISDEAMEAAAKAVRELKEATYPHQDEVACVAIRAFLEAEGFEVERAIPKRIVGRQLSEGWDGNGPRPYRLVSKWRPDD